MTTMWEDLLEKAAAVGDSLEDPTALVRDFVDNNAWALTSEVILLKGQEACRRFFSRYTHGGYGTAQVPPAWVYGRTHLYVVAVYDGATWWDAIPRYPEAAVVDKPRWVGGQ